MCSTAVGKITEHFQRLRRSAGVDRAVCYSVLSRAFSTAGGIITVPLILTRLSPVEQGFYYTFGSIVALQIFLELGFGQVAVQLVAHESAHLTIDLKSGVSGPDANLQRFYSVIRFVRNWYMVLAGLVALALLPIGFWFFSASTESAKSVWVGPWIIMSLSAGGALFVRSLTSMIEGMGFVSESIRVNMWGGVAQVILTMLGLLAGIKLYAVPVAAAVAVLINAILLRPLLMNIFSGIKDAVDRDVIAWGRDVFPYQWRIALSWISGWFIFNAMMPVVFKQLGAVEAGRFGLAISISGFISSLAMSWSSTKSAIWGGMASRKEWAAMDKLFWRVVPQAVGIASFMSVMALLLVSGLDNWIPRLTNRLPDGRVLFMLCFGVVLNQIVFAQAFYLRAHKREPFLWSSVFLGLFMSVGLFLFSHTSSFSVSVLYFLMALAGLVWGSIIFIRCRGVWHNSTPQISGGVLS